MRFLIFSLLLLSFLLASPKPSHTFQASGNVVSLHLFENHLYAATDAGVVDIFDLKENRLLESLALPPIHSFFDDSFPPKIFGIDTLEGNRLLILSEDSDGGRALFIAQGGKLERLFSAQDKLSIKEARFITPEMILLAMTSNEFALYDLSTRAFRYRVQLSTSTFSDIALSESRQEFIATSESGEIALLRSSDGVTLRTLSRFHKDNVYQLALASGTILSAGQDRKVGITTLAKGAVDSLEANFLIYAVGISPAGRIGAYMKNEESDIEVFEIASKRVLATLQGHQATLNAILFLNEKELISSADERQILRWRLP